jgi:hypothetical protein
MRYRVFQAGREAGARQGASEELSGAGGIRPELAMNTAA